MYKYSVAILHKLHKKTKITQKFSNREQGRMIKGGKGTMIKAPISLQELRQPMAKSAPSHQEGKI